MKYVFFFPFIFCLVTGLNVAFRDADVQANLPRKILISEASTIFHIFLPYLAYVLVVSLITDRKNKDFDYMRQASILNYTFIPAIIGGLLLFAAYLLVPAGDKLLNIFRYINYLFCGWTYLLGIIAHSSQNKVSFHRSAILLAAPILLVWLIVRGVVPRMFMP